MNLFLKENLSFIAIYCQYMYYYKQCLHQINIYINVCVYWNDVFGSVLSSCHIISEIKYFAGKVFVYLDKLRYKAEHLPCKVSFLWPETKNVEEGNDIGQVYRQWEKVKFKKIWTIQKENVRIIGQKWKRENIKISFLHFKNFKSSRKRRNKLMSNSCSKYAYLWMRIVWNWNNAHFEDSVF